MPAKMTGMMPISKRGQERP
ncbi:uncharacterized protein G2W53_044734 [Senna tora]|uniref:Uncharacterized protein n=1 Tax=Senna tora TaxID=362788 RepID=A0A834SCF6_9FABA|nr:uncharacterized protein G2W53_044734 [Senna tora]